MERKSKRRSDLQTYWRLFPYMHGTKSLVALLVLCMVLEAICTVGTISMIKPMVDLMFTGRLVEPAQTERSVGFERGKVVEFEDGAKAAVVAVGTLTGRKATDSLEEALLELVRPPRKAVVADLTRLEEIDARGWASLELAGVLAEQNGIQVALALPPETTVSLASRAGLVVTRAIGADGLFGITGASLEQIAPVARKVQQPGLSEGLKSRVLERMRPHIEALERRSKGDLFGVLAVLIAVMMVFALGISLASFGVGYLSSYLGNVVVRRLREHVYSHMVGLDLAFFDSVATGRLMSVITQDVGAVANAIEVLFSSVIKTPIVIMFLLIAMFVVSPKLTLFCLTVVPVMSVMIYLLGRKVRKTSVHVQRRRAQMSSMIQETFSGIRVVKAHNMEQQEAENFRRESGSIFRLGMRTQVAEEAGTSLTSLLGFLTVGAVILAGGYTVLNTKELSGSEFALFVGLLSQLFRPLKSVSKTNARIQRGLAGCDRVYSVLDLRPSIVDKPDALSVGPLQREICFENVTFAYERNADLVLHDINLRVPVGKAVAFVGETGAGKSTLLSLLPRFYDPTGGRITYDGIDLRDIKLKSLREQMSIITQEVILFDDTVANNIAYGMRGQVSPEQIEAAARAANAHKFITEKLPEGYETPIGSRGVRLSGGERQRLAIARAILRNAPILILDEATSSLDSETEALIQEALTRVIKGRTVFVIAHRLSTIMNCDEIYVMDGGRFVERGTHDELMALGGRYARYFNIQHGAANGRDKKMEDGITG
jgi:subfamily B ATP-binding cassette protein MsbA